uniref:IP15871p n=1 Tax=Drosophila melanogaster TaxID=7227 RepID=Q29QZ1_DROME|nr:IP15871p [Drosophila melanogaster]
MNTMPGMGVGVGVTVGDCENYVQQQQPQQQQPQLEVTPTHHRLQVRRQSTLPAQPTPAIYMSTSPNRLYSRSPERSPGEQQLYFPGIIIK